MEVTRRILVVLATMFVVADCFMPIFKRESDPRPPYNHETACQIRYTSCLAQYQDNPLLNAENIALTLILQTDEICSLLDQIASCLGECEPEVRRLFEGEFSTGDFLCGTRGRTLLGEVRQSVCVTDPLKAEEVKAAIVYCIAESADGEGAEIPDFCQQMADTRRCTIQTTAQQCGEAAGALISEIFDIISPEYTEQCSEEGSQEYLKRGVELLRKRFIK